VKVGYVTGWYPRTSDTFIQREVAAVRAAGVEVQTYAVRRPGPEHLVGDEQRQEQARTTYLLPASAAEVARAQARAARRDPRAWADVLRLARRVRPAGMKSLVWHAFYVAEAALLAEHLLRDEVEQIHNHYGDQSATVAMLAARLAGIRFSMTVHGSAIFFEAVDAALDVKVEEAEFVACISDFTRSQMMVFAPEACWPKLHVVHCGVEPARFELPRGAATDRFRVVAVGRLAPEKGVSTLLRATALAGIPELELVLAGDGPDRPELEALAADLGIRARFTGSMSQAEVRELLVETDVLASPGLAEGLPMSIIEAFAARVPVVSSRLAGIPELVVDGVSGRLVSAGNERELAAGLVELHALGPEGRRAWGEIGRAAVEARFDVDRESARLAALFRGATL
jgi:glycosyltransferase involved in cell wall biosynthesis